MADKNEKDMVRKIWLAGIGAYGRAFSEAKGAVDTVTGKSSEVFEQLVQKGEMLETVGKYKAEELLNKGKTAVPDLEMPDFKMDDRIARMRSRLFERGESPTGIEDRLAQLEAKLETVLVALDLENAANVAARKAPVKTAAKAADKTKAKVAKPASKKKMTTQKTKSATTAKAAPKKATPKKGPAKKD